MTTDMFTFSSKIKLANRGVPYHTVNNTVTDTVMHNNKRHG